MKTRLAILALLPALAVGRPVVFTPCTSSGGATVVTGSVDFADTPEINWAATAVIAAPTVTALSHVSCTVTDSANHPAADDDLSLDGVVLTVVVVPATELDITANAPNRTWGIWGITCAIY